MVKQMSRHLAQVVEVVEVVEAVEAIQIVEAMVVLTQDMLRGGLETNQYKNSKINLDFLRENNFQDNKNKIFYKKN